MVLSPRRAWRRLIPAIAWAMALVAATGGADGRAEERLEAKYRATLSGLTIGTGDMVLEIDRHQYSMSGNGHTVGLMRVLGGGAGEVAAQGAISGKRLMATSYAHTIRTKKLQIVKMALARGTVKQLGVEPPVEPDPEMVRLVDAHKRGVIDPLSASIVPAAGEGGVGPEACNQKMPIFDGRLRFDLELSYKRQATVRTDGYAGPAVVCSVRFEPISGHKKDKYAIRYLRENREMEIWFVPIRGTPFLGVYRLFVPTPLGPGVLEATRFVVSNGAARAGSLGARVQ
ncbi:MAG TPA: DUF3108 domain-containing protein [Xanthobacteraceae bacterium]|nr:DUF3108 domain-containing protein [Xanthobacteraceae bacterium]